MTGIPHQPGCGQASLPMYDWPEERSATDGFWQQIRDRVRLQAPNITLPENLISIDGDPAPHWRGERPVFSQSCWGPLEAGFLTELRPLAQPDYSAFEGGDGPLYRSVLVTRDGPVAPVPAGQGASALHIRASGPQRTSDFVGPPPFKSGWIRPVCKCINQVNIHRNLMSNWRQNDE